MARYFNFTTIILTLSLSACISCGHILVRRDDNSTTDLDTAVVSSDNNAQPKGESRNIAALLGPLMGGAGSAIMGSIGQIGQTVIERTTQAIGGAISSGIQGTVSSAIGSVGQAVTDLISQGASSLFGHVIGGLTGGGGGGGGDGGGGGGGGMMGGRKKRSISEVFNARSSQNKGVSMLRSRRHVSMKTLVDSPYDFKDQASFRTTSGLKNHRLELIEMKHHIKNR